VAEHARDWFVMPSKTAEVAHASFPKGNRYLTMRHELVEQYRDSELAHLFTAPRGRLEESPGILALVTVMQYAEGMTDWEAADMVRGKIDWKYALGLPLGDQGFDASILSAFRDRVVPGTVEYQVLEDMVTKLRELGLLKARGRRQIDVAYVLARIRKVNQREA
jgi:transposase